jgi:poly(beta-D-mannuronate) lyase
MKLIPNLLFITALIFSGASMSFSSTIWVNSPDELNAAVEAADPGDTIIVRNGIYSNAVWEIYGNGTEQNPIRVRAETPGKVISKNQSAMRISGSYVEVDGFLFTEGYLPGSAVIEFRTRFGNIHAENCRLTNTAIVDFSTPNRATRVHWVSLYGYNNRVDNCTFDYHNNNGVTLVVWLNDNDTTPAAHRVDNNIFSRRPDGGENGWETIRIGDSATSLVNSRVVVENNFFYYCDGEIEIISNKSCENIYRNNTFFASQGMMTLRHGDRCIVDGNWFIGESRSRTGGIRVMGHDHLIINNYIENTLGRDGAAITIYPGIDGPNPPLNSYFPADRAIVAFNTIVNATGGSFIDMSTRYNQNYTVSSSDIRKISILPEDVIVANNILLGSSGSIPFITGEQTPGAFFEGNVFWGNVPAGNTITEDGYRFENPMLERIENLWRIHPDSPVLGTAEGDYEDVSEDILGRLRDAAKDPGAFQLTGDNPPTRQEQPTADNSGVPWLEDDLKGLLWPVPYSFFTGVESDLSAENWLEISWLGHANVTHFPWTYLPSLQTFLYLVHQTETGKYWFYDQELGWAYTTDSIWPYFYATDEGWGYFRPGESPLRQMIAGG